MPFYLTADRINTQIPNIDQAWVDGVESDIAAQSSITASLSADQQSRYGCSVVAVNAGTRTCGVGVSILAPLPALTYRHASDLWTLSNDVITADSTTAGVYACTVCLTISDNSATGTVYSVRLIRGTNLATTPVIAEAIDTKLQISLLGRGEAAGAGGHMIIPSPGPGDDGREFGVLISHDGSLSKNVTFEAVSVSFQKVRPIEQR